MNGKIQTYKEIIEMRSRGLTLQRIADIVGKTKPRIHQIVQQWSHLKSN